MANHKNTLYRSLFHLLYIHNIGCIYKDFFIIYIPITDPVVSHLSLLTTFSQQKYDAQLFIHIELFGVFVYSIHSSREIKTNTSKISLRRVYRKQIK